MISSKELRSAIEQASKKGLAVVICDKLKTESREQVVRFIVSQIGCNAGIAAGIIDIL